jgi:phosphatidylserine/phosphatidylglycerophosphate/cardiolipin synthase-like enzyme
VSHTGSRVALALLFALGGVCGPAFATLPATASPPASDGLAVPDVRNAWTVGSPSSAVDGDARIPAVYPNPVADGDRGEFVVLDLPASSPNATYRLGDGEGRVALPNASGRVAVTAAPDLVRNLTDVRAVAVEGFPSLANGGERLVLTRDNETVARARYRDAPEGELGTFDDRGAVTWTAVGRTNRSVVTGTGGTATAFVLPDAADVAVETLRSADDRILLAGYTFTSRRVARALERAADRGVEVRVLLEGEPVDGLSRREARLLDSLVAAGVSVELLGGPRDRYAYHHAKYAVVDDRALVLTENWKPAGTGGHASRGWGVRVSDPGVVAGLAETFRADANWTGARDWRRFRRGRSFATRSVANATYPRRHDPASVQVERTSLIVAPDNAGRTVTDLLDGATESIDVLQLSIDGPDDRFLRATVRAARRGVDVRVLLSSAWYVREDNRRIVERLREVAEREGLPIEARLASPDGRFEKIHAKGVVVDGDQALVGSLNWNRESVRENREVMLLLEGEAVAGYYERVFEADWSAGASGGGGSSLPVGSIVAVAGVVVLAILVARRVEFGERTGVGPE